MKQVKISQKLIERDCTLHFLGEYHTGKVLLRSQKWYDKDEPWFFFNEPRFPWKVSELVKEGGKLTPLSSRRKS